MKWRAVWAWRWDAVALLGLALVSIGAWDIMRPLGIIVAGCGLIAYAVMAAKAEATEPE